MKTPSKLLSMAAIVAVVITSTCCVIAFGDHSVPEPEDKDVLVVYFSKSGVTRTAAELAASYADADIFEITAADPYPVNDYECQKIANTEKRYNLRPEMGSSIGSLEGYDVILLGFPIWLSDCPMIICTFLDEHVDELAGKTVIPFATTNITGLKGAMETITEICAESTVIEGLVVKADERADMDRLVREWISELDPIKA